MAHLTKYSMGSVRAILEHDTRTANHSYKNPDIDRSKTHLNYSFVDSTLTAQERLEKRLSEVKVQKRKDVNVLASWIVTLPTNYKPEEERLFFTTVNEFLTEKYGKDNIISSDVHLDETTPHLHFTFVPVVKNTRKYKDPNKKPKFAEKVCADELLTREHLQHFHEELDNYLAKHQLTQTSTHRTHVNVSISDLKAKTKEGIAKELELVKTQKNAILSDAEKKAEEILKSAEAEKQKQKEITEKLTKQALETEKEFLKFAKREISSGWHTHKESKGMFKKTVTISEQEYEDLYTAYDRHESYDYLQEQAHNYLTNTVTGQETLNIRSKLRNQRELEESLKSAREEVAYKDRLLEHYKKEKSELENKFKLVTNIVLSVWEHLSDYVREQLTTVGIKKSRSFHR